MGEIRSGVREKERGVEMRFLNHSPLNEGPNRPEAGAETLEKPVKCMVFFFSLGKKRWKKKSRRAKHFLCFAYYKRHKM